MNFGLADLAVSVIWLAVCVWAVFVLVELRRIRRAVVVKRRLPVTGGELTFPNSVSHEQAARARQRFEAEVRRSPH